MRSILHLSVLASAWLVACTTPHSGQQPGAAAGAAPKIAGYQTVMQNGETMYCRSEIKTGSVLPQRVCRTAKQVAEDEQTARALLELRRERSHGMDSGGGTVTR